MADSFSLPLRPLHRKKPEQDSLATRIAQINAQYGSFRDLTEAALEVDIAAEKAGAPPRNQPAVGGKQPDRREMLLNNRLEIMQLAMYVSLC